jgi:hypothetical protein
MNTFSDDNNKKNNDYSDIIKWTIAAYAPTLYSSGKGLNPLFIGGISRKDLSSEDIEKELEFFREDWSIIDKETADHRMIYLYNGGDDFEMYKTKIGALINDIFSDQIEDSDDFNDYSENDKQKIILRKSARVYVSQTYPEVGTIGSDLSRGMYLTSRLYLAGIYSFEEAMSMSIKIGQKLQKSFNNWDEYMENAFWGLQCQFSVNPYNADSFVAKRRKYYYNEKEINNGIYSLDWNTPLVDEWNIPNVLIYPDTIKWFNAAKALLQASNPWTPKIYPMGLMSPSWNQTSLKMLDSSWSIHNREDAEETIQDLFEGKVHNERFLQEWQYMKEMTLTEYIEEMTSDYDDYDDEYDDENTDHLDEETVIDEETVNYYKIYFNLFHTIIENYGDRGILAWDLYRAMYLNAVSYTVGFYTYEESLNKSLLISKKIQENFNSWDDYMNNYSLGYQYWSRDILENPLENPPLPEDGMLNFNESGTAFRKKLYQWLKNEEDSVYNIPWNTELKKEW